MKAAAPLLALLVSCAAPGSAGETDDPALLADLLAQSNPLRREEACYRLAILGESLHDAARERPKALAFAEEDTASMREGISRAIEERDPQRMVWRAYHALRAGCLARDWRRVSDALSRQGFRLIEIYEPHEQTKFVRLVAQAGAHVNRAGDRHDLFFWVQSRRREDGSWLVREVYVGLRVSFEGPFKQLSAMERYPRGSALAAFFELPELRSVATVYPILEEVELTYGRIRVKGTDGAPAGFQVTGGFRMDGLAAGRAVTCTAESGLDPKEIRRGRLDWSGFAPSDELGPLTLRGGGYWGPGGPKPAED